MSEFVAIVDEQEFTTVQAAIDSIDTKGSVKMTANSKENITIAESKDITLDLNGKILNGGTNNGSTPAIMNNGTITIIDTSAEKTGIVKREDGAKAGSYYTIQNEGIMTINGGTIMNNAGKTTEWSGSSLICNGGTKSAILNINGGTIEQDNFIAVKNDEYGSINIADGIINSKTQAVQNWKDVTISGGHLTGDVSTWTYNDTAATTEITGGTLVGDIRVVKYNNESTNKPATNISGDFTMDGGFYVGIGSGSSFVENAEAANLAIAGGSFTADPTPYLTKAAQISRGPDGKFVTTEKGYTIALKPKYPTYSAIEKTIFSEDDLIEILVDEKTLRKVPGLLETCYVAIVVEDKFYPVDIDNYEEQFALAKAGEPVTVKEDSAFGIKKLSYFVGNAIGDEPYKVMVNSECYNGIVRGTCKKVHDFETLAIDGIDANGYWMPFFFDLAKAEAEGYSDLKIYGTDKALVEGVNYINVTKNTTVIGIQGKLTVGEDTIDVEMVFDDRLNFFDDHELDIDPRSGIKAHN